MLGFRKQTLVAMDLAAKAQQFGQTPRLAGPRAQDQQFVDHGFGFGQMAGASQTVGEHAQEGGVIADEPGGPQFVDARSDQSQPRRSLPAPQEDLALEAIAIGVPDVEGLRGGMDPQQGRIALGQRQVAAPQRHETGCV